MIVQLKNEHDWFSIILNLRANLELGNCYAGGNILED